MTLHSHTVDYGPFINRQAINFRALCGASLIVFPQKNGGDESLVVHRVVPGRQGEILREGRGFLGRDEMVVMAGVIGLNACVISCVSVGPKREEYRGTSLIRNRLPLGP